MSNEKFLPNKILLFCRKNFIKILLFLAIFICSLILVIIGFYHSLPVLMVIGFLFIGLLLMYIFKRFNIKLIIILLTFTYVPAVALLWPLVHHFHYQIIGSAVYRLEALACTYAQYIDKWLAQRENDIFFIEKSIGVIDSRVNRPVSDSVVSSKIREVLLQLKNSSTVCEEIFILDNNKKVLISTDKKREGSSYSYIEGLSLDSEPTFTKVFLESSIPVVVLSKSFEYNNQKYIIGIKYNFSDIQNTINFIKNPNRPDKTISISLVNDEGFYIITSQGGNKQPLKDKIHKRFESYKRNIKKLQDRYYRELYYYDDQLKKTIGSMSQVKTTGWYVISEQSFREIILHNDQNYMSVFIIMIINFVAVLIFAPIFARGITKPILKIRDLAKEGASGNLSIQADIERNRIFEYKEADDTIEAFNKMIAELRELKRCLEAKVEEKTQLAAQLREANEELTAQQEELMYLNDTLTKTNQELTIAYKELRDTQTKLVQREKMASLGMLVAGVAHEINNPLGAIHSNISVCKSLVEKLNSRYNNDHELKNIIKSLHEINNVNSIACDRIMRIVKSLKTFARLDEAEYKEANIHEGIDTTLVLLHYKMKNRIEVVKNYGNIPMIKCYPEQLNQVFMNLLTNAIDAIPDKGTIWITTYYENDKVYIKIKDNGVGIKPEHIGKIFDPGFTTKGVGVGTGLGLSIVYSIIEAHQGNIWVESRVGQGTEFTIELPVS